MKHKKAFSSWIYPGLAGLGCYLVVRLINDVLSGENHFLVADQITIFIEITSSIVIGYLMYGAWIIMSNRLLRNNAKISRKLIFANLLKVLGVTLLIINATIIPVVAFTDDGLSYSDFTLINSVMLLITTIWYFYTHSDYFMQAYAASENALIEMEKEKAQHELTYLKSQVHPHFLFNALNTIYFQVAESNESAKNSIEQLSEILRYGLYETEAETVPLSKEIHYVDQYIALMKTRYGDQVKISKAYDIQDGAMIAPQLIFPLVENAFKHVAEKNGWVDITIGASQRGMHIQIKNSYSTTKSIKAGGVGLQNLRRRLALLYGEEAKFTQDTSGEIFSVSLSIPSSLSLHNK